MCDVLRHCGGEIADGDRFCRNCGIALNTSSPVLRSGRGESEPLLLAAMYQALTSRRLGYDFLIWQTPVLGLTAQAFLFTAALSHDSSRTARGIAAGLAFLAGVISLQLMGKHRHHEILDSKLLASFERRNELYRLHAPPEQRAAAVGQKRVWANRFSSYQVWRAGLALFACAALALVAITILWPSLL